jgi:hypothetical protein
MVKERVGFELHDTYSPSIARHRVLSLAIVTIQPFLWQRSCEASSALPCSRSTRLRRVTVSPLSYGSCSLACNALTVFSKVNPVNRWVDPKGIEPSASGLCLTLQYSMEVTA